MISTAWQLRRVVSLYLARLPCVNVFKGQALKGILRISGLLGFCCLLAACQSLPPRGIPQAIGITQSSPVNAKAEYVFCDLKAGAWRCEEPSAKTPVKDHNEIKPRQADAFAILPRRSLENAEHGTAMTVFFDFNSAVINDEQTLDIVGLVRSLKQAGRITVRGYTDNVGSERYNGFLAQRRANAVRRLLIDNGLAPDRIRAFGLGKCCYVDDNRLTSGRAKNRRVTISL